MRTSIRLYFQWKAYTSTADAEFFKWTTRDMHAARALDIMLHSSAIHINAETYVANKHFDIFFFFFRYHSFSMSLLRSNTDEKKKTCAEAVV